MRSRTLSALVLATFCALHLNACSSQDVTTEESVQATEDQAPAEASSDAPAITEKDKAIADAASSDFTDPSDVQLNDGPASIAAEKPEVAASVADAPVVVNDAAVEGMDTTAPAPVAPDLMADTAPSVGGNLSVFFGKSSARISREYKNQLKDLAAKMKSEGSQSITLSGHCDNRGSAAFNRRLAMKRARAVKSMLVKMGVSGKQIKIGSPQLAQTGENEQEHAQNRRVEVEFQ